MAKKNKRRVKAVKKTNTPKSIMGVSQTTQSGKKKILAEAKKRVAAKKKKMK
jgi:hypothetical protein